MHLTIKFILAIIALAGIMLLTLKAGLFAIVVSSQKLRRSERQTNEGAQAYNDIS